MFSVSVFVRGPRDIEVARHFFPTLQQALVGRLALLEHLVRELGMRVVVTSVMRTRHA